MVIDLDKCIGCHTCSVACKSQWQIYDEKGRSWLHRIGPSNTPDGIAYTFYSGRCNHCDRPACIPVCPVSPISKTFIDEEAGQLATIQAAATWKDPLDGSVQIDTERCIGCGACVSACPYEARYIKMNADKKFKADKCSFCVELLPKGLEPACVKNCLAGAILFGDVADPTSAVSQSVKNGAVRLSSLAVDIGPNVYYTGSEKNVQLLKSTVTPTNLPKVSERRVFLKQFSLCTKIA